MARRTDAPVPQKTRKVPAKAPVPAKKPAPVARTAAKKPASAPAPTRVRRAPQKVVQPQTPPPLPPDLCELRILVAPATVETVRNPVDIKSEFGMLAVTHPVQITSETGTRGRVTITTTKTSYWPLHQVRGLTKVNIETRWEKS